MRTFVARGRWRAPRAVNEPIFLSYPVAQALREPANAIRGFISSMVERIHSQHHFARLVIDENFHEGRHLKNSERVRALHAEMLATIEGVLRRGIKGGTFRKGIDALQLFTSMASLSTFYVTNMHTMSSIFGDRFDRLHDVPTIIAHIEQMVLGFIAVDPVAYRPTQTKAVKAAGPLTASHAPLRAARPRTSRPRKGQEA